MSGIFKVEYEAKWVCAQKATLSYDEQASMNATANNAEDAIKRVKKHVLGSTWCDDEDKKKPRNYKCVRFSLDSVTCIAQADI